MSSENQQFLKDVTASVLEGRGVGFLKQGRVRKLMEDENYRNFVVSRLNTVLEKKLTDENQHLEDVVRASRCVDGVSVKTGIGNEPHQKYTESQAV